MKKLLVAFLVLALAAGAYVAFVRDRTGSVEVPTDGEVLEQPSGIRVEAMFACAESKRFMVVMQGDEAKAALDDGRNIALRRMPRADEAEGDTAGYQSADGAARLILSSGFATSAFLEERGTRTYGECTALAEGTAALEASIDQGATGGEVRIVPLEVLEDSRCAIDVICVQAGTVRLRATLTSGLGEAEQVFELGKAVTTEAEEIMLSTVLPAARSTEKIENDQYRFYFSVVKRTANE